MRLGIIGTGSIAAAIVNGLFRHGQYDREVLVSRRNELRSARLAKEHPLVRVVADNQEIVDSCDWVMISVLPAQARAVLSALQFPPTCRIVSLVAGLRLTEVSALTGCHRVFRIIPLPPVELGVGPLPMIPHDRELASFLGRIGTVIEVDDEARFSALAAGSAIMASFFELMAQLANWLQGQGLAADSAADYTQSFFHALTSLANEADHHQLATLSERHTTIGGLNEQVVRVCREHGWFEIMIHNWDQLLERLQSSD